MKFLGTGSALPKKVVSNDDLAQVMDTSDEWIRSRTGIGMRHIAVEETTTSMAVEAAEKALADAKISGCEIDLIIAGTISPDYIFPSLACEVQAAIGAKSATAFDLSAGCSGFLFALATADAYFRTGNDETRMSLFVGMIFLAAVTLIYKVFGLGKRGNLDKTAE